MTTDTIQAEAADPHVRKCGACGETARIDAAPGIRTQYRAVCPMFQCRATAWFYTEKEAWAQWHTDYPTWVDEDLQQRKDLAGEPGPRQCGTCWTVPAMFQAGTEPTQYELRCAHGVVRADTRKEAIAAWNAAPWHEEKGDDVDPPLLSGCCEAAVRVNEHENGRWSCGCLSCGSGSTGHSTRAKAVDGWRAMERKKETPTPDRIDPPLLSLGGKPHRVTPGWVPGPEGCMPEQLPKGADVTGCQWKAEGGEQVGWGDTRAKAEVAWHMEYGRVRMELQDATLRCLECGHAGLYQSGAAIDGKAICAKCGRVWSCRDYSPAREMKEKKERPAPSPRPLIPAEAHRIPAVSRAALDVLHSLQKSGVAGTPAEKHPLTILLLRAQGFPVDALIADLREITMPEGVMKRSWIADILAKYDTTKPAVEKPPEPDCAPPSLPRGWGMIGGRWK